MSYQPRLYNLEISPAHLKTWCEENKKGLFLGTQLRLNLGFHLVLMIFGNTIFCFQIQEENYELLPNPGNALLLQGSIPDICPFFSTDKNFGPIFLHAKGRE